VKIEPQRLLTSSDVGDLLQVNPSSVKKWIDGGLLAAFRTPGGHRRIRASDLIEFLDAHRMPIPEGLREAARRRLLIVDDDVAHLKALARAMRRHSDRIEVVTTANGIDALVLVGSFQPHLVLLDVFMPGIDGLEVCRRLNKNEETRRIDVIVVSAHSTTTLKRRALDAGAIDSLSKPVDVAALVARLLHPFHRKELEARTE
jgi:excisionase family DNA binding protein